MTKRQSETVSEGGRDRSVADNLVQSSKSFARSAVRSYASEEWPLYYLHLATAVEHLVKGVLARINPLFIADTRGGFDSILHLAGMGHRARTPDFVTAVRTVPMKEALERVARVVDKYKEPGTYVSVLLDARNGVVHAGHTANREDEAVLGDVARYVAPLIASLGMTESDYWGDAVGLVQEHARRRLDEIEASFERRMRAAQDRFAVIVADRPPAALETFFAAVEAVGPAEDFGTFPVACPACGRRGILTGTPEPEWEPDWDYADGQTYVAGMLVGSITLRATVFECPICRLVLEDSALNLVDLDVVTFRDDAFDTGLAYDHFRRLDATEFDDDWYR